MRLMCVRSADVFSDGTSPVTFLDLANFRIHRGQDSFRKNLVFATVHRAVIYYLLHRLLSRQVDFNKYSLLKILLSMRII